MVSKDFQCPMGRLTFSLEPRRGGIVPIAIDRYRSLQNDEASSSSRVLLASRMLRMGWGHCHRQQQIGELCEGWIGAWEFLIWYPEFLSPVPTLEQLSQGLLGCKMVEYHTKNIVWIDSQLQRCKTWHYDGRQHWHWVLIRAKAEQKFGFSRGVTTVSNSHNKFISPNYRAHFLCAYDIESQIKSIQEYPDPTKKQIKIVQKRNIQILVLNVLQASTFKCLYLLGLGSFNAREMERGTI